MLSRTSIQKLQQASVFSRSLSSFTEQRVEYEKQVSLLRKSWKADFQAQVQLEEAKKAAEKNRLILEKAKRLRESRKATKAKHELVQKERELAHKKYLEKLASTHLLFEKKQEIKNKRLEVALEELEDESKGWITLENYKQLITADLFGKEPASTGITTSVSDLWKYQIVIPTIKEKVSSALSNPGKSLLDHANVISKVDIAKRVEVDDFVNQMISSGRERSNFKNLSERMRSTLDNHRSLRKLEGQINKNYEDETAATKDFERFARDVEIQTLRELDSGIDSYFDKKKRGNK